MKLYLSHTSPFGRLCLTRAWQLGLNDLTLVFIDPWQNPPELEAKNPFSRIPVLETGGGVRLTDSLLICQYLGGEVPSAEDLSIIGYASALLENAVSAFKLENKAGEGRDHFLVKRSLEAISRALPHAPAFCAGRREWPQLMLAVCLLTLKLRYPEIFAAARADTRQETAAFAQLPFVAATNPEALGAKLPATVGDILS